MDDNCELRLKAGKQTFTQLHKRGLNTVINIILELNVELEIISNYCVDNDLELNNDVFVNYLIETLVSNVQYDGYDIEVKSTNIKENTTIDISTLSLGDVVHHEHFSKAGIIRYGRGEVIKCTEKPSVIVQFKIRRATFTENNINQLTNEDPTK